MMEERLLFKRKYFVKDWRFHVKDFFPGFHFSRESRGNSTKIVFDLIVNFEISSNKYDSPLFPGHFLQQSEVPQS